MTTSSISSACEMVVQASVAALVAAVALAAAAKDNPPNFPKWLPRLSELRRLDPKWSSSTNWKGDKDCLAYARYRVMRPYPGTCYTKGGSNLEYQSQWWSFWKENRGDITYTFDYVFMYKNNNVLNEQFENQLWYNIAYLKQLRISIPNPEHIGSRSTLDKKMLIESKRKSTALDKIEKSAALSVRRMHGLKTKLHSKLNANRK